MTSSTTEPTVHVRATYENSKFAGNSPSQSPAAPFTILTPLALPDSESATYKTAYLSSLREAVSTLQERVNSELTARMEEEAREVAAMSTSSTTNREAGKGVVVGGVDEAAEEENYGEEVVEDEEE
ncbi:hypothetical protein F5Y13DRAFT_9453 [Hypoxylon sp. FL1857]|nr:hypothetical protein F5Y13DRAFT_9453 [Hypoxylon sp. FL1857]